MSPEVLGGCGAPTRICCIVFEVFPACRRPFDPAPGANPHPICVFTFFFRSTRLFVVAVLPPPTTYSVNAISLSFYPRLPLAPFVHFFGSAPLVGCRRDRFSRTNSCFRACSLELPCDPPFPGLRHIVHSFSRPCRDPDTTTMLQRFCAAPDSSS